MSRAFVLLDYDRRKVPRTMTDKREVPVQFPEGSNGSISRPLVTTTGKVIAWLVVLVTSIIALDGWLLSNRFESIVDRRFKEFELQLIRQYAQKGETMTRVEYDLRHNELIQMDKQLSDRMTNVEHRMETLGEKVGKLENRR